MKGSRVHHRSTKSKRRAPSTLPDIEEQFRLLVGSVREYEIFLMDTEGRVLTWNSGAQRIKGYRQEEVVGKPFDMFYTPEEIRQEKPRKLLSCAASQGQCEDEGWRLRKDGSKFWAKVVITALRDEGGRLRGFGNVTRDMSDERAAEEGLREAVAALDSQCQERTCQLEQANAGLQAEVFERRHTEEKLESSLQQLRALGSRVQVLREEERKRISREVHDELGQSLTAIKMDLSWLSHRLSSHDAPLRERIKSTLNIVDETVASVRRIASELRPGILDDLGLAAAIDWQSQEFQARTGIRCQLRITSENIPLEPERAAAMFRMFQEILNNIAQHARATQVQIRLMQNAGTVILEIRDNGKGVSEDQISDPKSLGLLGMRERALLLGGHVAVHGEEGRGTAVVVQIPIEKSSPRHGA